MIQQRELDPGIVRSLWPSWTKYIPHDPTPKQLAFLLINTREAFYGGAAGGGKSDALLMAALQYVHIPYYSALLLRRTYTDLKLPGALIYRSHQWLDDTDAVYNPQDHYWVFPSGATIQFGYIGEEYAESRYQSSEFQFIGWDEVAQHLRRNYTFMFSRLRRLACSVHQLDSNGEPQYDDNCEECTIRRSVPVRVRGASNPPRAGDPAADGWLKKRFKIKKVDEIYRGTHPHRPYIPAFIRDNPFIDQKSYEEALHELDPVTRDQLLKGDWGVTSEGRFRRQWSRQYSLNGDYVILGKDRRGKEWHKSLCILFQTVDPAASVKSGPGDEDIWTKKSPSWSVISTWLLTPDYHLLWWDVRRFQKEVPDVLLEIKSNFRKHMPEFVGIECNGSNIGVYQMASASGIPVRALNPRSDDKLVRATAAAVRMEEGKVWFPEDEPPWMEDVETELYTWTGHPHESADIVDTFAYAALYVNQLAAGNEGQQYAVYPHVWA
jgi:phage terminase large subunit-like protein